MSKPSIVYVGAPKAGCNANLSELHARLEGQQRSPLQAYWVEKTGETGLFFQKTQPGLDVEGMQMRCRVISLPGGLQHREIRRQALQCMDAMVVVADARKSRREANQEALERIDEELAELGRELSAIPCLLQVNHSDASDAIPLENIVDELNPFGFRVVTAAAQQGRGVLETYQALMEAIVPHLRGALAGQESPLTVSEHAQALWPDFPDGFAGAPEIELPQPEEPAWERASPDAWLAALPATVQVAPSKTLAHTQPSVMIGALGGGVIGLLVGYLLFA
ncbi:MAG TPA: hypothetical protein EYQ36_05585 [Sulfitobacter sp.]|nr:hypothetical protein [Sulfitobacter sp.]